jgi:hypothetical protein
MLATMAHSAGLRTPFGEVIVRNVKIGQTYSLYKLLNLPMRVINTGNEETDIAIEVIHVSTSELRKGYEQIGSTDWVRLERSSFTVGPSREAVTDVIINLPNDPALLGRRFEADIFSRTISIRGMYVVGLQSKLLMHVDSTPPTEEELKKKFVDENLANLDFTVIPVNSHVTGIPIGQAVDLRKEKKINIKLINPNERDLNFRVRSVPHWESMIQLPDGYEAPSDPKWLVPEKDVVKVEGNSIGETSMTLTIPKEDQYRAKKFFFILSFEVLEQKIPTHVYYRLMVETAGLQETSK